MDFKHIEYKVEADVAHIYMNDPKTLNAISVEMGAEILEALKQAPNEARAVILGARGRGFCSGANLSPSGASSRFDDPKFDMGISLETIFNPMFLLIKDYPVPFITSVRGPAVGFGCALALMGDIILCSKTAFFLQSFSKIGLTTDGGASYLLSRAIGRIRAMEIMLLGSRYTAEQAHTDGLVTRLVEDDDLDAATLEIAKTLAAGPPISLKFIRQSAWAALDSTFADQLERERSLQREAGRTRDFREGVKAYQEKRKPEFKGI